MKTPWVFEVGRLSISLLRRHARNDAKSAKTATINPIQGRNGLKSKLELMVSWERWNRSGKAIPKIGPRPRGNP